MFELPILIAGHSNTRALGVPGDSMDGLNRFVEVADDAHFEGFTGPRTPAYWDELVALSARRTIALSWGGSHHTKMFLILQGPRFDFALKARPDLPVDSASKLIPELAIREALGMHLMPLVDLLSRISKVCGTPPIVLGTPPPRDDHERIRAKLGSEGFLKTKSEELGVDLETVELVTPLVWLKSWLVLQQMMCEIADASSCPFCASPPEAQTPDGFLREEFREDITHANEAYGVLMRRDILRLVQAPTPWSVTPTEKRDASV